MKKVFGIGVVFFLVLALTTSVLAAEIKPEGRIFVNYSYNISNYPDWDSRYGENDYNEFGLSRAYLGFKVAFNDQWSARITGDVARTKSINPVYDEDGTLIDIETSESYYDYYLKYAYGNFQPYSFFGLRFGLLQTAYIETYDNAFGYRYVLKSPVDMWKFDSSADLGVAAQGELPGGLGSYWLMVRNGEGYKNPEENKGKAVQARLALTPLQMNDYTKGLQFAIAYMLNNENPSDPDLDTTVLNMLISYKAMFNQNWGINLGGGYDMRTEATDVQGEDDINSTIVHGFGVLYMPYHLGLFARYDMFDPDTENDEDTHGYQDENSFMAAGISIDPIKNIAFALSYQTTTYTAQVIDDSGDETTKSADSFIVVNTMLQF